MRKEGYANNVLFRNIVTTVSKLILYAAIFIIASSIQLKAQAPTLGFTTYFGGTMDDDVRTLDVDDNGNLYIGGLAFSTDFPVTNGAFQTTMAGGYDSYLAKFNSLGVLEWATYIGGSSSDYIKDLTTDKNGNVYMVGYTRSGDFPVKNAFQPNHSNAGDRDGFIAKFDGNGNMIWATYFGGAADDDVIGGIAVDDDGRVYITGETQSDDFYVTAGAFQDSLPGWNSAFISRFTSAGQPVWSTFYGGNDEENGNDIVVDHNGDIVIGGEAYSLDCPLTTGHFQDSVAGSDDAFLLKMDSLGNRIFATVLGGTDDDDGRDLAVDKQGNIYLVGDLKSTDFPTTAGAFQPNNNGTTSNHEGFVIKFDKNGQLLWSTYLGGGDWDGANGVFVDAADQAFVVVETYSADFPVTNDAFQSIKDTSDDYGIVRFDKAGGVVWSTFFGGGDSDDGYAVVVKGKRIYIGGDTESDNMPLATNTFINTRKGMEDGFVAMFNYQYGVGINDVLEEDLIQIYPVPADNQLNIILDSKIHDDILVEIMDINGKLIYQKSITQNEVVNTGRFSNGIYFMNFRIEGQLITKRIAIIH
jgi:Secretion system C-terminal sorting domain/Beta-propeller repeat